MSRHLNDHELASAAAGTPLGLEQRTHLDGCISCRNSVALFLDLVDERRQAMEDEGPDWDAQLDHILGGLPNDSIEPRMTGRRWLNPLLAAAATITIAIGTGLILQQQGPTLVHIPQPDINVEEILAQTDALLAEEGFPGLDVLDDVSDDDLEVLFGTLNS